MLKRSFVRLALAASIGVASVGPRQAEAGPLLDLIFGVGRNQPPAYPVGPPVSVGSYGAGYTPMAAAPAMSQYSAGYAGNYGTYYGSSLPIIGPSGAGYTAGVPGGAVAAAMPPNVSYVPNFTSNAYRAPVTYYRPLLTTDPNTGSQVVAMAPCTSYEYQTQRVPTLGRSALFGSYNPPANYFPSSPTLPTYTLPSGGIPLASSVPSVSVPYASGYGTYSALQPPLTTVTPTGPTVPMVQAPYYNTGPNYGAAPNSSCGTYGSTSVPGLSAAPAPMTSPSPYSTTIPGTTVAPSYVPPTQTSPGVFPPANGSMGTDPANLQPTLPFRSSSKPQLRSSIVQQPAPERSAQSSSSVNENIHPPVMSPIPVPKDFEAEPNWSPGLLRENDMTARIEQSDSQVQPLAGQSKTIQWASFETPVTAPTNDQPISNEPQNGMRPRSNFQSVDSVVTQQVEKTSVLPSEPTQRTYSTGGWKASR